LSKIHSNFDPQRQQKFNKSMETHSSNSAEVLLIDQPLIKFKKNVEEIGKLRSIGKDILEFSKSSLVLLLEESEKQRCHGIKRKIETTIQALENIGESSVDMKEKLATINNQSLVLLVSNFERFLSEYTILLVEEYSYLIKWPEKKFSIDLGAFQHGTPTLGEVVLRSLREKYNFQDLKSILDFTKDIFGINISLEDSVKDNIIFFHALRHILIHNLGIVDNQFLKQIRNIRQKSPETSFTKDEKIDVSEKSYHEAESIFVEFGNEIHSKVRLEMTQL